MLIIKDESTIPSSLLPIIKDFQKKFVSEFPVTAVRSAFGFGRVVFVDARIPHDGNSSHISNLVGALEKDSNNPDKYVVTSRLIKNAKYKDWRREHHSVKTKDAKAALKAMFQYFKPFSNSEVAVAFLGDKTEHHNQWVQSAQAGFQSLANKVSHIELMTEVMAMTTDGTQFKTAPFQRLAVEGIEKWEEFKRRKKHAAPCWCAFQNPDETWSIGKFTGGDTAWARVAAFELLPAFAQQQMSILKITAVGTFVPEVGVRNADNVYWLYATDEQLGVKNDNA